MKSQLSIYIHIPFCFSKCNYCDFFSVPCSGINDSYVYALCNELDFRLKQFSKPVEIKTIYIGGGTPSLLKEHQLQFLFDKLRSFFPNFDELEISIELNPDDITLDLLMTLEKAGINRISCGIQSLNNESLLSVNRRADRKTNLTAINLLKQFWHKKLSFDLIAGLPFETKETFVNGLKSVINSNPDHISLYTLTVEEGTKLFNQINNNEIEYDFDFNDELWLLGKELLEKSGYRNYEVSNFAKKGFECRHNLTYWNHQNYLGIGSGGTGSLYNSDGSALRWTNTKNIAAYINYWTKEYENFETIPSDLQTTEDISISDSKFEFFMMGLRTCFGVTSCDYESSFGEKMPEGFLKLIKNWEKEGFAEIKSTQNGKNYSLNEKGILFLNKFLNELDI